jgi:DNA-binding CsgD family transcriptional regulator
MRMEAACWEGPCPFCGHERAASTLEAMAKRHSLTTAEVRVLKAVLTVNGVRAVAELLELSQATVKTHLHHLFRKTGANRQSDLVKLVAGL